MSHSIRDKTFELLKLIDNINITTMELQDLEIGIYNWTIDFAERNNIIKNWDNNKFKKIYINKSVSIVSNLNPDSYLKNNNLHTRLENKEFKPHEIPYLSNDKLFPEKWNSIKDDLYKREQSVKKNENISKTDQFKCMKCKKRECSYYELQTRSADESATLFITCLNCGAKWRQ